TRTPSSTNSCCRDRRSAASSISSHRESSASARSCGSDARPSRSLLMATACSHPMACATARAVGLALLALLAGCSEQTPLASSQPPAPEWPDFCGTDLGGVPGARARFDIENAIVREKLDTALLPAMRAHGIDMWIVLDRENNNEPLHAQIGGGFSGVR